MKEDAVRQVTRSRQLSWSDLGGVTLLLIGLAFVAVNLLGDGRLENWWGLFILLPGLLFLGMGWQGRLRQAQLTGVAGNGRFSFVARFSMGVGLVVTTVAVMFLLDLNWRTWWPLMLIVPGVALWTVGGADGWVVGWLPFATAVFRLGRWFAVTMILLGLTFLADQLALINLRVLSDVVNWWAFFILLPGLGAFVEALRVLRRATWTATALLIVGVWIVSAGVIELLDPTWISWEGMVGVGLIGTGLASRALLMSRPAADSV